MYGPNPHRRRRHGLGAMGQIQFESGAEDDGDDPAGPSVGGEDFGRSGSYSDAPSESYANGNGANGEIYDGRVGDTEPVYVDPDEPILVPDEEPAPEPTEPETGPLPEPEPTGPVGDEPPPEDEGDEPMADIFPPESPGGGGARPGGNGAPVATAGPGGEMAGWMIGLLIAAAVGAVLRGRRGR